VEVFALVEGITGNPMNWEYVDKAREGDHICYISNLGKIKQHYPQWSVTKSLNTIVNEIVEAWAARSREICTAPPSSVRMDRKNASKRHTRVAC
jgi:CDP-paratose 2-epimerase